MKFATLLVAIWLSAGSGAFSRAMAQDNAGPQAAKMPRADSPAPLTVMTTDGEVPLNLPPGTKSVLKRPATDDAVQAGYDGGALVPVPAATHSDAGTPPAGPSNPGAPRAVHADRAVRRASGVSAAPPASRGAASSNDAAVRGGSTAAAPVTAADAAQAAAAAAGSLFAESLTAPKDSALVGRPTTLLESMSRVGSDRSRQAWIVRDYWRLSAAEGDYDWAADELARLDRIGAAKGLEAAELSAAQAAAQARLDEARVGVVAAQQELADLLGITGNAQLPLASDVPLVGPYRTYFDTLFAARVPPPRTRAIDRSLPIRLEAIQARTAAVQAATSAVHYAEESRAKGQLDLRELIDCQADLARQRRSFLTTVRDYNLEIGEYALAVADPSIANDRLVAMMILVKSPAPLTATGRQEPTLARPPSDEALLQPALPAKSAGSTDRASGGTVRRPDGAGERSRN